MSYPKTMTTAQLEQFGFYISPDDPKLAINEIYPNLSFRHQCDMCGNWSATTNGQCRQCLIGHEPLKPTKQYFKFYLGCCGDKDCRIRLEAVHFLKKMGFPDEDRDGNGSYINLSLAKKWTDEEQSELFLELNNFSVSKYGARKLAHPKSKATSKLPKSR